MPTLPHSEDWELCPENAHSEAQRLLTEEWYWNCIDDNSPFGNDTGADTLVFYSQSRADSPSLTGGDFLTSLLTGWEMDPSWEASTNEAVRDVMTRDRYGIATADDAAIAVAFAQLLLAGRVEPASRERALLAISREQLPVLLARWADPEERSERLAIMRRHLLSASSV